MTADERRIDDLAEAVVGGKTVDWDAAAPVSGRPGRVAHTRYAVTTLAIGMALYFVPGVALAQVDVSGIVTDASSGEALAGVTVEVSSPALIEKQKTTVTDEQGRYLITGLRPGVYTFTFAMNDRFATHLDVSLTGSSQKVDSTLGVRGVGTVVQVSGQPPGVDTRSVSPQHVVGKQLRDGVPMGTSILNAGALPAEVAQETGLVQQDVGDTARSSEVPLVAHGSKGTDQTLTMDGLPMNNMVRGTSSAFGRPATASTEEITIDTATPPIESAQGGVRVNVVPQQGGDMLSGKIGGSYAGSGMQASNYTDELKQRGLVTPGGVESNWDTSAALGGPFVRDCLWFFVFGRGRGADFSVPNMFYNSNAHDPLQWQYVPNTNRPAIVERRFWEGQANLNAQIAPRHNIRFLYDHQSNCLCPGAIGSRIAPEASRDRVDPLLRSLQAGYTFTASNRVLIELGAVHRLEKRDMAPPEAVGPPEMVAVMEQGGAIPGLQYRSAPIYLMERDQTFFWRAKLSYITGSHQVIMGVGDGLGSGQATSYSGNPLSFRLLEGIPNQFTMQATPYAQQVDVNHDLGVFAEHKWTRRRLTTALGLRYDYFASGFPAQHLGPGLLEPNRNLFFPAQPNLRWHDLSPRIGLAYDLSGNGRTAVRASVSRSLAGYGTLMSGVASDANPIAQLSLTASRSWIDANGNYGPDCDVLNPDAQDLRALGGDRCDALDPVTFGTPGQAKWFDSNLQRGWGKRDYNWFVTVSGEHQLSPGIVAGAGYFRRSYRNFQLTDNRAAGPDDFDTFSIVAPIDPRLPGGGGYIVEGFPNVTDAVFGQVDNFVTLSRNYGKQIDQWSGVDVTMRATLPKGIWVRGGLSTGQLSTDNCEIVARVPEALQGGDALRVGVNAQAWLPATFCRQESPWLTQLKAYGGYEIPKVGTRLSAVFQSLPGVPVLALYFAPNAEVRSSLGRDLSGGASVVPVHLVKPGTMYGERLYQLDVRLGKTFASAGRSRFTVNVDLYNALNASTVLTQNNRFRPGLAGGVATWQTPTEILQARLLKLGAQLDF